MKQIRSVKFIKGATQWSELPDDGRPEVAFLGRSNVGKSSLLNMLVGRKALARTSRTPGKTQELNYYLVDEAFYLVDLPGLGYAKVSKTQRARWTTFIRQYLTGRAPLRVVCHLIDSRHPPTAIDEEVMQWVKDGDAAYLILLTKADKLSKTVQQKHLRQVQEGLLRRGLEAPVVLTSAEKGLGREAAWTWMQDLGAARAT